MHSPANILPSTRAKTAAVMMFCGLIAAASSSVANAATADAEAPTMALKFDPAMLNTEDGAREVYRRIVRAAEEVCPAPTTGSRLVNSATQACRDQAVANAVRQIHSPRLVAVYTTKTKHG
jgi:UrcA family protein